MGPTTRIGRAAMTPTAMAAFAGVWKRLLTLPHTLPSGRCRSRPIENIRRVAAPWIASVHTKHRRQDDEQVDVADRQVPDEVLTEGVG